MNYQGEQVQPDESLKPVEPIAEVIPMGDTVYAFRFKERLSPEQMDVLRTSIAFLKLPFKVIVLDRDVEIFKLTK
jgi:hypothetical protein